MEALEEGTTSYTIGIGAGRARRKQLLHNIVILAKNSIPPHFFFQSNKAKVLTMAYA